MSHCDSLMGLLLTMALQAAFLYYFPPHKYLMPLPEPREYLTPHPFCAATHFRRDDPVSGFTEVYEMPPNWDNGITALQTLDKLECDWDEEW